jgi:hypothetical protein
MQQLDVDMKVRLHEPQMIWVAQVVHLAEAKVEEDHGW